MTEQNGEVKVTYRSLLNIWLGLLFSQFVFLLLIYFIKPHLFNIGFSEPFFGENSIVVGAFLLIGVTFLVLSFIFRRQHIRRAIVDHDAGCFQTGLLLGCALSEGCSILGLVLALAFNYPYFYVWMGVGILGVLLHFPRKGNFDAATFKFLK